MLRRNELLLSKERERFKNIDKTDELSKKIGQGDLTFLVNSTALETNFSELKDPVAFLEKKKKKRANI